MPINRLFKAGLMTTALVALCAPAFAQRHDDRNQSRNQGGDRPQNRDHGSDRQGGDRDGETWSRASVPTPTAPPRTRAEAYGVQPSAPQTRDTPPPPIRPTPAPGANSRPDGRNDHDRADNGSRPDRGGPDRGGPDRGGPDRGGHDRGGPDRGDGRPGNDRDGDHGRPGQGGNDRYGRDDRRDWNDRDRNRQDWGDRSGGRDWRYTPGRHVENRWDGFRRWDRDWHRDRRYDWQDWRRHYYNVFRLPRYYAPYGWTRGYYRFSIGVYISDIFFSTTYWIDDPYRYRLPPAYGPFRWIRYYNDALLVDLRDGYVVDVVYDIFW